MVRSAQLGGMNEAGKAAPRAVKEVQEASETRAEFATVRHKGFIQIPDCEVGRQSGAHQCCQALESMRRNELVFAELRCDGSSAPVDLAETEIGRDIDLEEDFK